MSERKDLKITVNMRFTSMNVAALFIPYTPEGCEFAKYVLDYYNKGFYHGITGWEIVYLARKTMVEAYSNE